MNNKEDWVTIGKFGRPHGIKGLTTAFSYNEPHEQILNYDVWFARLNNTWQQLSIISAQQTAKSILVRLDGYNDREAAALLTNVEIAVKREQLAELMPDEYYWCQLIGMNVINKNQVNLGIVSELIPTGANDVLVVKGEKRLLIPYVIDKVIIEISLEQQQILVDWDTDF